jgi:hypothetical protein
MPYITIEKTEKPVVDGTGCQNNWINVLVSHMQAMEKFRLHDKLFFQECKTIPRQGWLLGSSVSATQNSFQSPFD